MHHPDPKPPAQPRLCVIVPVRNDPRRLRRCLGALARSSFADFEIIVADDASTDDTPAVALAAARRALRMRVLPLSQRMGPAGARNAAARIASAPILFFVDSDVLLHEDALARAMALFEARPEVDALFGSYDQAPEHPAFVSQYKNLSHHFVHQQARQRASTFWSGCGAIRKDVFLKAGGFDTTSYQRPCIEDIELGARLTRDGRTIVVEKDVLGTHLKRWSLRRLVRTDVFDRGIPWTRLILREKNLPNDLNLGIGQRLGALLAALWIGLWLAASWFHPPLIGLPFAGIGSVWAAGKITAALGKRHRPGRRPPKVLMLRVLGWMTIGAWMTAVAWVAWRIGPGWSAALLAPLVGIMAINARYYAFFIRVRSVPFAVGVLPLHGLYYLYSGFALAAGIALHVLRDRRALSAPHLGEAQSATRAVQTPAQ